MDIPSPLGAVESPCVNHLVHAFAAQLFEAETEHPLARRIYERQSISASDRENSVHCRGGNGFDDVSCCRRTSSIRLCFVASWEIPQMTSLAFDLKG